MNGNSWDFCVFENAFNDSFLELGFVEVSSNGNDFYRFPSTSFTQDPYNKNVYISDAIDYVQNGLIYRLDSLGNEIDLFNSGIIPNDFLFD